MRKEKKHTILRILLLTLFLSYYGSIVFFPHYHIVDGVRIVHSHFYKTTADQSPNHTHTGNEIKLIAHLNYLTTVLLLLPSVGATPLVRRFTLYIIQKIEEPNFCFFFDKKLRAPPIYI